MQKGSVRVTYLAPIGARSGAPRDRGSTPPPCDMDRVEVAYAFGRRFGTAVERNRARRRLRDAFTTAWVRYREHHSPTEHTADSSETCPVPDPMTGAFLLSGSRRVLTEPFTDLVDNMLGCLDQLTTVPAGAAGEPA